MARTKKHPTLDDLIDASLLPIREVHEGAGISPNGLRLLRRGEHRSMHTEAAERLAAVLGVTLEQIRAAVRASWEAGQVQDRRRKARKVVRR